MTGADTPIPHPSAHPEAVAIHAIRVLDAALRERFGVRVPIGAELEFTVHFKPDAPAMQGNARDPLQLQAKLFSNRNNLFPHSKFVQYCYLEGGESPAYGGQGAIRQYEAVTDHRHPLPPDRLPRALNQLRHELRTQLSTRGKPKRDTPPSAARIDQIHAARTHSHAWAATNLDDLRFDSGQGAPIINGLHLNFSLVDTATGDNLLSGADERSQQLIACSRAIFADPDHLLFHTNWQEMRRRATGGPDVQLRSTENSNGLATALGVPWRNETAYIENKTPGADCNMHYAVLMQLAAVYEALAKPGKEPSGSLEGILNELEPGLGTRFLVAERAHPECRSFVHEAFPVLHREAAQR